MALLALAMTMLLFSALPASPAGALPYPDQKEGDFVVRDFELRSGETLPEVRLHYTTLGKPQRDATGRVTNAVLLLHGTTQTSKNFFAPTVGPELFGPGQVLDAERWYVIVPDGLGRGGSTKPSDGLRARFPRYGFHDVVTGHHLLVTKALGVDHLRAVVGVSMGGMMTWMWGERYPDMADALMPIACQPMQISGRNLLWRRIIAQAIRGDPDWQGGEYREQPRHWTAVAPLFTIMVDSPVRLQSQGPTREAAIALHDKLVEEARASIDANDYLYVYESSWDYDPEPELSRIKARVVAVNFADDELNPPELGLMEKLVSRVPNGRFVLVPRSERTIGHRTLTLAAVWKPYLEELLRSTSDGTSSR